MAATAPHTINIKGDINTLLATDYQGKADWAKFILKFKHVSYFDVCDIDNCTLTTSSSFDQEFNAPSLQVDKSSVSNKYILSTYDHVIVVFAQGFEFYVVDD